jgi:hypothetical protein
MTLPVLVRDAPAQTPSADGRWVLYTGQEVLVAIPGLSPVDDDGEPFPIRVVFDLASLTAPPRFVALQDHDQAQRVGSWSDTQIADSITASLRLVEVKDPIQAEALEDVIRLQAEIQSGVPLQVSLGVGPGPQGAWQRIAPGQSVTVNGRTFTAGPDETAIPLVVLRGGLIEEASLLTFGADSDTGRAAAHRTHKAAPMITAERLQNLQKAHAAKHHGKILALCAAGMDDTQIAAQVQQDDQAEAAAAAAAQAEQLAKCQAALDAMVATPGQACPCCGQMVPVADPATTSPDAKAHAAKAAKTGVPHRVGNTEVKIEENPKTVTEGIVRLRAENPKLTALAARSLALKRWPAMAAG